jgi:hypothetical protein
LSGRGHRGLEVIRVELQSGQERRIDAAANMMAATASRDRQVPNMVSIMCFSEEY